MSIKLICLIFSTILIIILFAWFRSSGNSKHELTEEQKQIISVANKKAMELGYDINNMITILDFNNVSWRKHHNPQDPTFDNVDFQAIYYGPKERMLGGSLEIVIDKQTMEVIWFRRGQ